MNKIFIFWPASFLYAVPAIHSRHRPPPFETHRFINNYSLISFYSFLSNKFEEQNDRIIVIDQREKIMENG